MGPTLAMLISGFPLVKTTIKLFLVPMILTGSTNNFNSLFLDKGFLEWELWWRGCGEKCLVLE